MRWADVACIGMVGGSVALVSLTGCNRYIRNSKAVEARSSVGQIAKLAANAYETERIVQPDTPIDAAVTRRLCASAPRTVPASSEAIRGIKYQSTVQDWTHGSDTVGWPCLKFEMTSPQYYMYAYRIVGRGDKSGDTFTATARGDLNGDGKLSTIARTGTVTVSGVMVSPALTEIDPLE